MLSIRVIIFAIMAFTLGIQGTSARTLKLSKRLDYEDCSDLNPDGGDQNQCLTGDAGTCTYTLIAWLPAATDSTEAGIVFFDSNCNPIACYYVGEEDCDSTSDLDTSAHGLPYDGTLTLDGCSLVGDSKPSLLYDGTTYDTCYAEEDDFGIAGGYAYRCPFVCTP